MDFITTRDAGQILGCSAEMVARLLRQKRIEGQLITRRQWIVNKESVLKYKETKVKKTA